MSATDTSQPSSDFLKSPRVPGDFELNSWTHGLGGAPRPNPIPPSSVSAHTQHHSPQSSLPLSTDTNRYPQSSPSNRQDSKLSPPGQLNSSNPFLSASFPQASETRPESRGMLRDAWSQAQTSDLQSFDLSNYVQSQPRSTSTPPSRDFAQTKPEPSLSARGFNDWGHQAGSPQETNTHSAGYDQLSATGSNSNGGEFDEYESEGVSGGYESRFASKKILLSTILIGALILGGGVSYLYNSFFGGDSEGPTPVVKNDQSPSKVKPTEPGGKQFAHADSKILGRLNDTSTASETDPATGSRKVSTLVVGRDGAIQSPSGANTEASTPSVSVPVPGMTLIDTSGSAGKSSPSSSEVSSPSVPSSTSEASASGSEKASDPSSAKGAGPLAPNAALKSPSANSNSQETSAVAAPNVGSSGAAPSTVSSNSANDGSAKSTLTEADLAQPSQNKIEAGSSPQTSSAASSVTKPKTELKTAAIEPTSKATRPQSAPVSGLGYVAVLASVPVSATSRMVALQQYADLQQQYNGILQNKTPDVQEANLGEKGRYHRLIIGPPGSKEAANSTCAQLKSAGYTSCWIMAY